MGRLVAEFLVQELGEARTERLLVDGGEPRSLAELRTGSSPSSYDQLRRLLEAAGNGLGGAHRLEDAPLLLATNRSFTTAELLRPLGSPDAALEAVAATRPLRQMFDWAPVQVEPGHWDVEIRSYPAMPAYRELCAFMAGMHRQMAMAFGCPPAEVVKQACMCDGAPSCRWTVRWSLTAPPEQAPEYWMSRVAALEEHLRQFQLIVTDLVSDQTHEAVMRRIVEAASRALSVPAAVLTVTTSVSTGPEISAVGLSAGEARRVARQILAGRSGKGVFAVDVASSRSYYGKLALVGVAAEFISRSPGVLESYARMAAAVLDSAVTLSESRRQAATATALLDLSQILADLRSVDDMAASIAKALPALIDCDRTAVLLTPFDENDTPTGELRLAAGYGDPERAVTTMLGLGGGGQEPVGSLDENGLIWTSHPEAGSVLAVAAPIVTNGDKIGWVVASVTNGDRRLRDNPELPDRMRGLAAQAGSAIAHARLVDRIRYRSMHDALTDLANRALILDRLEQMIRRARRTRLPFAVLFLDLDGFKDVNDTLGHDAGDVVLRATAERLVASLRISDTVGRLGGDEFIVLVEGATFDAGPELVAERLLEVLREPIRIDGTGGPVTITASIGIATGVTGSAADLLRDADIALYEAKRAGKNAFAVFQPAMQTALQDQYLLEMDLRSALANNQFFLMYQPIFDLATGRTTGVEALLRWRHPQRGLIGPDQFVPLLESAGLMGDVGRWVLAEACRQGAEWHAQGFLLDLSINVSARQLDSDDFVRQVDHALEQTGFPPESLTIEITETALMRNVSSVVPRLEAIKTRGIQIAIDDFGTGYSSLAYLRQLPVDTLKIDQSFVAAMVESSGGGALIHTLVQLGKTLGLKTLAEGIEQHTQYSGLREEQCDEGQGYLYARPLPAEEVTNFVQRAPRSTANRSLAH